MQRRLAAMAHDISRNEHAKLCRVVSKTIQDTTDTERRIVLDACEIEGTDPSVFGKDTLLESRGLLQRKPDGTPIYAGSKDFIEGAPIASMSSGPLIPDEERTESHAPVVSSVPVTVLQAAGYQLPGFVAGLLVALLAGALFSVAVHWEKLIQPTESADLIEDSGDTADSGDTQ